MFCTTKSLCYLLYFGKDLQQSPTYRIYFSDDFYDIVVNLTNRSISKLSKMVSNCSLNVLKEIILKSE